MVGLPVGKESACSAGDPILISGSGRSPGERKGYPLQYSGLENSLDCIGHGVAKKSDTTESLSFFTAWLVEECISISFFLINFLIGG